MANDVYAMILKTESDAGNEADNVIHFSPSTSPYPSDPAQGAYNLCNAFETSIATAYMDCISEDCTLVQIMARCVNNGKGPTVPLLFGLAGNVTSHVLTDGIAVNLAWEVGSTPYRAGHTYMPCVPESFVARDIVLSAGITAYSALANALLTPITDVNGVTWTFGIYGRKLDTFIVPVAFNVVPKLTPLKRRLVPSARS